MSGSAHINLRQTFTQETRCRNYSRTCTSLRALRKLAQNKTHTCRQVYVRTLTCFILTWFSLRLGVHHLVLSIAVIGFSAVDATLQTIGWQVSNVELLDADFALLSHFSKPHRRHLAKVVDTFTTIKQVSFEKTSFLRVEFPGWKYWIHPRASLRFAFLGCYAIPGVKCLTW